ncbi:hypothetical protein PoB_007663600 [Plakobranchus ocellatus]|uniref:Transmembrane protein n=1 Tax=Plakobranchus ocellatus TaxID=259542 RepID=A0AAV4E218_9GAST|nr:hypothetical protein PoB_007663600 [Plakobranchus ocellatus]
MRENKPGHKYPYERQVSFDERSPHRGKGSFRNRARPSRLMGSNTTSPDWEAAQAKLSRKISDMYKNPQLYTGLWQNTNPSQWNFPRACLLLVPSSLALQYCVVFPALLSAPNLILLGFPQITVTLQFLFAGILGVCFIFAIRTFVRRFYNQRKKLLCLFLSFIVYFTVGAMLVLLVNIKSLHGISSDNATMNYALTNISNNHSSGLYGNNDSLLSVLVKETKLVPTSQVSSLSQADLHDRPTSSGLVSEDDVSLLVQIFAFVGYVILASSVGSGQYLLQSIAMTSTHSERHQLVVTIATVASAAGGFLLCAFELAGFYLSGRSSHRILDNLVLLSSINICLLSLSAGSFLLAWRLDTRDLRRNANTISVSPPRARRPSRTPQEIFDECAHLLGHHSPKMPRTPYHSRPPKYYDPNQQRFVTKPFEDPNNRRAGSWGGADTDGGFNTRGPARASSAAFSSRWSSGNLLDRQETFSNASERSEATVTLSESTTVIGSSEILKRYSYTVPKVYRDNNSGRQRNLLSLFGVPSEMWKMVMVPLFVFCLCSSTASFECTATTFLSMAEAKQAQWYYSHLETAVRKGSDGFLMAYVAYALGLMLYSKCQDRIGWRKLTLGLCLVSSVLTLLLAIIRDAPELFHPAAIIHGLLKVMVLALPHLLTLQSVRSQGGHQTENRRQLLIETPTSVLWSMTPSSLALTGAVVVPLIYASGRVGTPMMYSAISGFMGCLGLIVLL